jgi:hypothetical protein
VILTFKDLAASCADAEKDPWKFFDIFPIKDILKAVHPDKWPSEPTCPSLFMRYNAAYKRSQQPKEFVGVYPLLSLHAEGDLRDVFNTIDGNLVKVPKIVDKAANRLIEKEAATLNRLKKEAKGNIIQYFFPHMVDSIEKDGKLHNVTIYDRKLHTAAQIKEAFPTGLDGRHIAWMLRRMLVGVGYMHSLDLCHGAITPEHVMFCVQNHAGVLTGIIHSDKTGEKLSVVPAKRKDWYPDFAKKGLTPSVDFAMIGRVAEFLANDSLPKRLKNFVKALSLPSLKCEARVLEEDLKSILFDCYGPPKFVDLVLEN